MSDQPQTPGIGRMSYWLGWGLSGVAITFFLLDAAMKLLALPMVLQANAEIGFQGDILVRELGIILPLCTVLYAAPPTATLGAILLTGYLGGICASAIHCSHMFCSASTRVSSPGAASTFATRNCARLFLCA
jgi:DoxX-like family